MQDGLESVRKLRAWELDESKDDHHQCVLGASACMREETRNDAMGVGLDAFVLKPLEIPVLLDTLNELHTPFENIL